MAEDQTTPEEATQGEAPAGPPMVIHGQYIKDLSFEVPGAPSIFGKMANASPDVSVSVDVNAQNLHENQFEVTLQIRSECKVGDDLGFVVELAYAGLFQLNVPQEHIAPMLLIEAPRMLFPFARNIVADVSRDGAFPPLMLSPVDFAQLYQQRIEAEKAKQAEAAGDDGASAE